MKEDKDIQIFCHCKNTPKYHPQIRQTLIKIKIKYKDIDIKFGVVVDEADSQHFFRG